MSPKWIVNILKYYSLFGLHFVPNGSFGGKSTHYTIYLIQMSLCIWCSVWAFKAFLQELELILFLDALNLFLYYLTNALTYWAILYDSYTNKNILCGFWRNFEEISETYSSQPLKLKKQSFFLALISILVIDVIMFGLAFYRAFINSEDNVTHYHFLIIYDQRQLFYLLHLVVVNFQLQKIQTELKHIEIYRDCMDANIVSFIDNQKLKWIRENYRKINEMVDDMNKSFGVSNLAITMLNLHSSIAFTCFMYRQIHHTFYNLNTS